MTAPHALHDSNRADPGFRTPDLQRYKAALTEGSVDIERSPNWVSRASLSRWQSNTDDGNCAHTHRPAQNRTVPKARLTDKR